MNGSIVTLLASSALLMSVAHASAVFYPDRATFMAAVGESVTDGYTAYGTDSGNSVVLSDAAMSAVVGETDYTAITTPGRNLVGDVFVRGDESNYCAGCNGNFRLSFGTTSFSKGAAVYGVGLDIVLHTSRYVSIGDDDPTNPTYPGGVLIEFADGTSEQIWIPADIGYYQASTYFLGITDHRGIASVTVGTEAARPHFWIIDNLTVAGAPIMAVVIDITPGKEPNSVNPRSAGVIPVALLTTSSAQGDPVDFDATQVDPMTVKFGPAGAPVSRAAVAEDVDGDGDADLVLHFATRETGIVCGDTAATLRGTTYGGSEVAGTGSISTVGCR